MNTCHFDSNWPIRVIEKEPSLAPCNLVHAYTMGGPITRVFLEGLPPDWKTTDITVTSSGTLSDIDARSMGTECLLGAIYAHQIPTDAHQLNHTSNITWCITVSRPINQPQTQS